MLRKFEKVSKILRKCAMVEKVRGNILKVDRECAQRYEIMRKCVKC